MPVDPTVQRFLDRLAALNPPSALKLSVTERRDALLQLLLLAGQSVSIGPIENRTLPGPGGELAARVYTPADSAAGDLPGLVYFHGGGFVAGDLESHDSICRSLAQASGCRLMAVAYRLAPEHPFPAAIEDGYAATCWIAAHAAEYGVDPLRLGVGGDSAGAALATAVCQRVAASRTVPLALQLLLCPVLDYDAQTASRREFAQGYFLDQATLEHDRRHYLGSDANMADPRISPLRAADLTGVAPACIHTAQFDPVRDEGELYSKQLKLSGVPTTYYCHPGMIHLFYGMGRLIPYAATAYRLIGDEVRFRLRRARQPHQG